MKKRYIFIVYRPTICDKPFKPNQLSAATWHHGNVYKIQCRFEPSVTCVHHALACFVVLYNAM